MTVRKSLPLWLQMLALVVIGTALSAVLAVPQAPPPASDSPPPRAEVPPARDDQGPPRKRYIIPWKIKKLFDQGSDLRQLDPDEAAKTINAALGGADPADASRTRQVFDTLSFAQIEAVAKAKKLTKKTSDDMARHRRELVDQAHAAAVKRFDPEGNFTLGALDSGNKASGIASDVDQTAFLLPRDAGSKPATPKEVETYIHTFNDEFKRLTGKEPDWYGVEVHSGADFYPDWYGDQTLAEFRAESDRVHDANRKNPEAYQSEGEIRSQPEGRGHRALQEQIKKLDALARARLEVGTIQGSTAPEAEKVASLRRAIHELVQKVDKKADLAKYEVNSAADAVKALKGVEETLGEHSPWTEFRRVGKDEVTISKVESPLRKVLPNEPEFHRRFAFDGAWDNWIMYMEHPHNRTKYLIRSVAEGSGVLHNAVEILNGHATGKTLATLEYDAIYGAGHRNILEDFVRKTYGHLDTKTQDRFKRAMDVAAKARLRHKGAEGFKQLGEKQVFAEYIDEVKVSEAEKRQYADAPRTLEKLVQERAERAWEADAREIMIENLLITSNSPAELLRGGMSEAEFHRLQADPHFAGRGSPEKLEAAALKQFEHAFLKLMTVEHARDLHNGTATRRLSDPVDRILRRFRGTAVEPHLVRAAKLAAARRLASDPEEHKTRAFFEGMHKALKERLEQAGQLPEDARREFEKWKKGEPGYTIRELGSRLVTEAAERYQGRAFEYLHGLGFEMKAYQLEGEVSRLEVGKWDRRQALCHLVSLGNFDGALQVLRTAVEEGDAKAAAQAAFFQAGMNLPYVAEGAAFLDLVQKGDVRGVVQLGAAYYIPGAGQAYMICNIARNAVWLGGYVVFKPLEDDIADKTYQGFLDRRAGIISTGVKEMERSRRPSLLINVRPLRVIPHVVKDTEGNPVKGPGGKEQIDYAFAEYSFEEALELNFLETSEDHTYRQDYEWLRRLGLLGGGKEYDALLKEANNEDADPKRTFEARRASLYFAYEKRALAVLAAAGVDLIQTDEAFRLLKQMFAKSVRDWLRGEGEFSGRVDGEVNLLIADKVDKVKEQLAERMARDFLTSYQRIGGDKFSIENCVRANIKAAREKALRTQANQMLLAYTDAAERPTDPQLGRAIADLVAGRKIEYRVPAPRITVRPRAISAVDDKGKKVETVDCLVSVIADPDRHPRTAEDGYRDEVKWETVRRDDEFVLRVKVRVNDAKGNQVGEVVEKDLGTVLDGETPIAVRRHKEMNIVEVSWAELAKVNPKEPSKGFMVRLYRSQSSDGPFLEAEDSRIIVLPADPRLKALQAALSGRQWGMLDKDRVGLKDLPASFRPKTGSVEQKPLYYQVGFRAGTFKGDRRLYLTADLHESGAEVRSPISSPGRLVVSAQGLRPGTDEFWTDVSAKGLSGEEANLLRFGAAPPPLVVALSLEDQQFDVSGAEIVVTMGTYTRHFFTPRTEGDRQFGPPGKWNEARVAIAFPPPQPGKRMAMQIRASARGQSAERTIQIVTPEDGVRREQPTLKEIETTYAERLRQWESEKKQLTEDVAARRKTIDEIKDPARREEELKGLDAWSQGAHDLLEHKLNAMRASHSAELAAEALAAGDEDGYQKALRDHLAGVQKAQKKYAEVLDKADTPRKQQRAEQYRVEIAFLWEMEMKKAEEIAAMTGNREAAKRLFLDARQLQLAVADAIGRKNLEEQWARDGLPAWWPEEASGPKPR
jgi:hypothetical protein